MRKMLRKNKKSGFVVGEEESDERRETKTTAFPCCASPPVLSLFAPGRCC